MKTKRFILKVSLALALTGLVTLAGCSGPLTNNPAELTEADSRAVSSWPVIQQGANSAEVRAIQYLLNYRGYSLATDSSFGPGTASAVRSFQSANGLSADGIVGSATWSKLIATVQYGSNNNAVKAVQYLLNAKFGKSLTVDGAFGSGTKSAVVSFQSSQGISADGIVGPTTWLYLVGSSNSSDFWGSRVGSWVFPVSSSIGIYDINGSARYFGASRDGGTRAHAGVDIVPMTGPGTSIRAMTNGTVQSYYAFYYGTYALQVKNDDGTVVRYTEITSSLRAGARVYKGQNIGTIIRNSAGGGYMLHLEVYKGDASGALTNTSNTYYPYVTDRDYHRRWDLINPMGVIKLR